MDSKIFKQNIETKTIKNKNYRKVVYTDKNIQIVYMSLNANEDIPREKHTHISQFIRVEAGTATVEINNKKYNLKDGDAIVIPPGTWHYVKNTGDYLKLYTIYSKPEHPSNRLDKRQPTK